MTAIWRRGLALKMLPCRVRSTKKKEEVSFYPGGRPLPEIEGKVECINKSPSIDGCVRCAGRCGIELIIN
jgi:hypothetical protein